MNDDPPLAERRASFEALALPYERLMQKVAARRFHEDSRDVVQEALLNAWRNWPPQNYTNIRAWLLTILRNTTRNVHRRRQLWHKNLAAAYTASQRLHVRPDLLPLDIDQCWDEPALWMDDNMLARWKNLGEKLRMTVFLVDILDHSYEEAAGIQGTPLGTALNRRHRACHSLRGDKGAAAHVA